MDIKYTQEHEKIYLEDGGVAVIGITEFARHALGDLVYIELPEPGTRVSKGEDFAAVESVKVTAEIYSPVSGEIIAVNNALNDNLDLIAESFDKGWIAKIKMDDPAQFSGLMDEAAYKELCAREKEK